MLPQIIHVFRNSDPVAFYDSYLIEIKIILTHHLAHKNMPDNPQDFTLISMSLPNLCIVDKFFLKCLGSNCKITSNLCLYSFF